MQAGLGFFPCIQVWDGILVLRGHMERTKWWRTETLRQEPASTARHVNQDMWPGPLNTDHEGGGGHGQASATVWQSSSSMTPRSNSHCLTRSCVTSTSHASPVRDPTPSSRYKGLSLWVCPSTLRECQKQIQKQQPPKKKSLNEKFYF